MIKVEHLSKKYGDLTVLKDITVDIAKGDVISIIGPSGTGKSTFLRCLNLLERPSGGNIYIDGVDILDKKTNVPFIRRKMGMVFQSFNLFEHLSISENLIIGQIQLLGRNKSDSEKRAMELLKMVGLAEKYDAYPVQLSGGQKQRVAIARCMSMDPEIILFDEPTSALDPTMVSEVLGVIRQLSKTGITMLIVTHEMNFAKDVSTRVFYMDEGVIYEEGVPAVIFNNPQKEKTRLFINRVRSLIFNIESDDFDLYSLNSQIEVFSAKYFFTYQRTQSLLHIVEELLQILFPAKGVNITLEYSEKDDNVIFNVTQYNFNKSIINDENVDLICMSILKGLSNNIEERIDKDSVSIVIS